MSMRTRVLLRAVVFSAMAAASSSAYCATVTWDAGSGDNLWSNATNWSPNGLPTSSDDVVITNATSFDTVSLALTVTVKSIDVGTGATLRVESGQVLTVTNGSVIDAGGLLDLQGGSLAGTGNLVVDGLVNADGATISGSGILNIHSSGVVEIGSSTTETLISRATTNAGTITALNSSSQGINFDATITNTGLIDFKNNHDNNPGSGSPILNNDSGGIIRKSVGTGVVLINFPVNNAAGATIEVLTGDIALNDGGTASGEYAISSASVLSLTGTFTMSGAPTVTGGGTFLIDAGATLDVGAGVDVTCPNITLSVGGTITGAGDMHVTGNFTWSGGTISGGGLRVLESTSVPTISCSTANCLLDGAALQLQASTTFSASSNALVFSNGASLTIDPGKTFSITANGILSSGIGGGSIFNDGTLQKTGINVISTIGVPVTLSGTSSVSADSGRLQFGAGASVAAGATLNALASMPLEVTGGVFLVNGSVSMTGSGDFRISSGTLHVATGVTMTIPYVILQGSGVIDGAGDLHVSNDFDWRGGTITGSGARVLDSTSAPIIQCSTGHCNLDAATLQMNASGTLATFNLANSLIFSNAASLVIASSKTLDIISDGTIVGLGTITNNGTITKTGGTGIRSIGTVLHNNGSVIVTSGGLSLLGNGTHSGSFTTTAPGSVLFDGGTHTIAGGISGTGIMAINGATVTLNSAGNVGGFNMSGGTLDGSGALQVSGNFNWLGGTIAGSGPRVLNSTSVPTISCSAANCLLDGATLQIQAHGTYSASSNALVFSNGASLILDPGKLLFVTNDGDFLNGGGAPSSIVVGGPSGINGAIEKTTTSGTSIIGVPVTLAGSFKTDAGTLQIAADVTATSTAIVHYGSGTTIEVTGGVFLLTAGTISFPANGDFKVSTGTLRVPTGITISMPNVMLQGSGVIDGPGTLILSGASTWAGGTMGSATAPGGITRIDSGNTLNIIGGGIQTLTQGRELQNSGTVNYSGTSTLTLSGASKITNDGALNLTADGNINVSGSATIDNNGTLDKSGGSGTSTLFPTVNGPGTVSATTGTLALAGGGTLSGNLAPTAPWTIAFPSGTYNILGTFGGTGTTQFNGATATVSSPFTIPILWVNAGTVTLDANGSANAFSMTGGTLGGSGVLTLNNGGNTSAGTMSGSGTIVIPATKTFSIFAAVTLNSRTLQNDGTLFVAGNVLGSGSIDNGGTLNVVANVTIGTILNNDGQIATSNALSLTGGGTHTGTFNVTTPGNLSFSSGTHSLSGGGSISGTGTLTFDGATAAVGVPVNVGALSVSAGTATLDANGSAEALTMTGGTLGGSGVLTLNNGGTWSGGTMSGSGETVNPATKTLSISAPVTLSSRTLQNDGTLTVSGDVTGSGTIDNGGTLNAIGNFTIGAALNNSGQVVTSNALSLAGGGTHTGSFTVTTPGNLSFSSGTHSLSGGSISGNGTLTFSGATATVGVPVNAGALNVTAGTATLDANGSADAFTMTGGTLGGSGVLTLNNGGTWSGGTMSGSGETVNPAAKTLSISAPVTLSSRTLQNDGTLNVSANVLGSGTVDNQGTLSPVGNITVGAALNNSGQIATNVLFSLAGNGAHSGTFTTTAPGVIDFSGGTQTISGTLGGTGTVRFSGAAATVSGTWTGMPIEVIGGSVAFNTNGTIPALTLSGGTLAGSGDVIVSGPSTWSGGTLAGSGDFTFDTGVTVTMPGTSLTTLARELLNKGTINFTAASNGLHIAGVALKNNGTFNIQSSQAITADAGTPPFLNRGTLKKSSGSDVMQFRPPLSNSGLVRIESGTMQFGRTYAQSAGRTTILSGATLQTATLSLDGGSLTGNGTVAGTLANNATISPGSSPGTLTINGDYVQSPDGALEIQLDGTAPGTQYDRLLVSGSVTLGGTLDVTTSNGFIPTPGNAFQIITFGSRTGDSTFDVMNGLNGLVPTFSATDLKLVSQVIIPVAVDVGIVVTGPESTIAGTKAIYTVMVSNSGPDTATNIVVTATASLGLTFSGNSGACVGSFPCNIATLSPGQSATIHSAWDIAPSATGSVQLTVHADSAADANTSNDSDTAITNIGTCPAIAIVAPDEMTSGLTAEATATPFSGATYHWSIVNGTIDRGDGTAAIEFTAGEPGTTSLAVNVIGGGCSLSATFDVTIKDRCLGTATPTAPADGTTADAVVDFAWTAVDDASGYRLWLQQDGAPDRNLGTALGTSHTRIIPPGVYRWYVETLFDGCASHESERRGLTILAAQDCASRGAPQLNAPANETLLASAAVAFSWNAVEQALEYELWLAPAGGVPTLIRTTSETSVTAVVPPGRLEWYVRAIFAGCTATESAHRAVTYSPPPQCTSERPLLIAPLEAERLTSPVSFEWTSVSGATSYELYVDGLLAATTISPQVSGLPLPRAERRWQVRARLGEDCGAVDSAESRLVVIPPSPSCAPLGSPVVSAPGQISSGIAGRIQWSFVAGATAYEVEISGDPQFARESTSSSTVTARQLPIAFTNQGSAPVARYVRVHAVDTDCVQPGSGAFSPVAEVSVLPPAGSVTGNEGVALLSDPTDVPYTLSVGAELAGQSFTATPTVPWLSVTPASGVVPPGGQTLRAVAHTAGLPPGTSTGNVEITTTAAAGALTALATTPVKRTIAVNNIAGVTATSKSTPPPDALIIPAVASVKHSVVRFDSDICFTNTSARVMKYELNFVPSGPAGISKGLKTDVSLDPGATMAINDIVATWFGSGGTSTGTLEIRPATEIDTLTSSAPVDGLANRITFASSRTFSTTAAGGTYGQYVPAVLYANFVAKGTTLSLQHIAQSDQYDTNLGLVEGSGENVLLEVRIFDAAGTMRASFDLELNGGERMQKDSVLSDYGLALDDGRIEVEVKSDTGKVTAYASVIDNDTNDPQFVPPVTLDHAGHNKWVVPGVADLVSGSGNWQTDVRIFNAGTEPAELTLAFYSMNGGPPATRTITLAAGEVRQFDRVLSFFAISGDAGALHVSSAAPAQVVATARTYKQIADKAYGQFIAAVTPDEAVAVGTRPLQILQMEESTSFKSNIGFAEVSGKPVTLEVAVYRPNSNVPAVRQVNLGANQFLQLNLSEFEVGDIYNARISVRAVGGEGQAVAYGSLIDHKTGDPTYIPGQ